MKRITVLLVEDHQVVRQGLRLLIDADGGIEVVGEAKTGREGVQMANVLRPEVIVMDIAMPQLNGLEATRQILRASPAMKILILSAYSDPEYVQRVIKAGASGYVIKQSSGEAVVKAIRELHKGKTFFTPSIAQRLKDENRKSPNRVGQRKRGTFDLTSREAELLQLVAEGQGNKQVASELGISIKTVEKHRQNLMRKLDIHDIAGLTRYAIAAGIIESSVQSTTIQFTPPV